MPGDTVEFAVTVNISDYFAFQNLSLSDTLPDGLRFDADFTPLITFSGHGQSIDQRFSPSNYTVSQNFTGATANPPIFVIDPATNDGTTTVTFRLSDELVADGSTGKLIGGGIPDSGTGAGALPNNPPLPFGPTTVTITYRAVVQDQLSDNFPPGAPSVVPGDTATNQAAVNGSLLNVRNVTTPTGSTQGDDTHFTGTIAQTTFHEDGLRDQWRHQYCAIDWTERRTCCSTWGHGNLSTAIHFAHRRCRQPDSDRLPPAAGI